MHSIDQSAAIDYCKLGANNLDASLAFSVGGTKYTSAPTVAFSSGGGTGAAATSTIGSNGSVTAIDLTNAGSGYTSAPTVALTSGGGSGATGVAVLSATGSIKSLTVDTGGTGYTNGTHDLVFAGGGGTGATGTATIAGGIVTGVTLVDAGEGYTSTPGISLAASAGAGNGAFAAHAVLGYTIDHVNITSGGGVVITFTDNTTYVSPDARNVVNISMYDHFSSRPVEGQMTGSSLGLSIGWLDPTEGINVIATVISTEGNRKNGTAWDLVFLRQSGNFYMQK